MRPRTVVGGSAEYLLESFKEPRLDGEDRALQISKTAARLATIGGSSKQPWKYKRSSLWQRKHASQQLWWHKRLLAKELTA